MSPTMLYDILIATGETLYMVILSTCFAALLGLPLGTCLFVTRHIKPNPVIHRAVGAFINFTRSIPFIILLVALIPITRLLVGTSIGLNAAIVPLTLGAIPFFARLADNAYHTLPRGLFDATNAMGATTWQVIRHVLLPEARPALIQALTVTATTLVNYSAMAGTVGGGGLGDLAIRYGYQRFDATVMITTVLILVVIVQIIQTVGDKLSTHLSRGTL
jgi:D-methionine transport system permease protein